jgi:hypothetical protein
MLSGPKPGLNIIYGFSPIVKEDFEKPTKNFSQLRESPQIGGGSQTVLFPDTGEYPDMR